MIDHVSNRRVRRGQTRNATVLVVDDEPNVRAVMEMLLIRAGYTVLSASSGAEAVEIAERDGCCIDLVLSDLLMPGMSGAECVARIVALHPGVAVLIVSGTPHLAELSPMLRRPGSGFIPKPFEASSLLQRVEQMLVSRGGDLVSEAARNGA